MIVSVMATVGAPAVFPSTIVIVRATVVIVKATVVIATVLVRRRCADQPRNRCECNRRRGHNGENSSLHSVLLMLVRVELVPDTPY